MRSAAKPPVLTAVQIGLPEGAEVHDLPADFGDLSDIARTRALGDLWVRERRALALRVPSLAIRQERNLILDPEHPDTAQVAILRAEPSAFDPRLVP
jgi:RES domain-containing protein